MFGTSWKNSDEQKDLVSIGISCNSKMKPSAIITNVISAAINISQKDILYYFSILLILTNYH